MKREIKIPLLRLLSYGLFLIWIISSIFFVYGFWIYPSYTLEIVATTPGPFFVLIPFLLWAMLIRYRKWLDSELNDHLTIIE